MEETLTEHQKEYLAAFQTNINKTIEENQDKLGKVREELGKLFSAETFDQLGDFKLDDLTVIRFLTARNMVVQDAVNMLAKCIKWRLEFKPNDIKIEDLGEIVKLKQAFFYGRDRDGNLASYIIVKNHKN
eukprot:TRINITY_DN2362_c0_g1_i1.p1 TRINITY_DN2362_c0_g1~~TRINITY_DN2362_c0_g1_i1.p1  ORF type:complete len:130 (-),score=16.62 TRINITY_DN2362_c0_g1_i1:503-892(-)